MQIRGPAIDHTLHVISLHDLRLVFQGFASAFAHNLRQNMIVGAVEKHRFSGQSGFLIANATRRAHRRGHQRDRDHFTEAASSLNPHLTANAPGLWKS